MEEKRPGEYFPIEEDEGGTAILSSHDLCCIELLDEIAAAGICSFKIEGRMKSPDYVYGVTSIYRRLLDEGRRATDAEIASLDQIFSRDGFTDGYFKKSFIWHILLQNVDN